MQGESISLDEECYATKLVPGAKLSVSNALLHNVLARLVIQSHHLSLLVFPACWK